ncbi:prepilin peptidase [Hoyosella sp. G463]|uniref:Prepilin peptidase n=1 Tax=Lolliginicoccus lacisalsi TaxID=2742202 RepID=A0A927PLE6_9ACTN|nr:prepilin peptidase [Lolliginicoccus lacisalsi]MBD8505297.1 prepilin peptidase [Lolliginicoccus lacisalsi]
MLVLAAAAVPWMAILAWFDLRQHRLPNGLTLGGAVVILAVSIVMGQGLPALAGGLLLGLLYLVPHVLSPRSMGGGDVKLALGLGALAGPHGPVAWFIVALGAPVLTILAGAAIAARERGGGAGARLGRIRLPHGPSLCGATALALILAHGAALAQGMVPGPS